MNRFKFHAMFAIVVALCLSSSLLAQSSSTTSSVADRYLISVKAGGVNYVEGGVSIIRAGGTSGVLLKRDRVQIGDRVSTGADGRAEILLNPGSFIRLGKNSSFEFGSTDLEDLQITLDSGSAMFEVFAHDEFRVSVFTPRGKVSLIETGIYRVDVSNDGAALLSVSKGKAEIGDGTPTIVKDGRTGTVGKDTVAIAKFDRNKRDDLGEWSKTRSKELVKVASSFQSSDLSRMLNTGFSTGRWNARHSFGLWMYSAEYGGFCFMPYGYGWRSPYGYWYNRGISWYNYPYNPSTPVSSPSATRKIRGADDSPAYNPNAKVKGNDVVRQEESAPPFTKINRGSDNSGTSGYGRTDGMNNKGSGDWTRSNSPSSSFPSSSPPTYTPPAPPSTAKVRDN